MPAGLWKQTVDIHIPDPQAVVPMLGERVGVMKGAYKESSRGRKGRWGGKMGKLWEKVGTCPHPIAERPEVDHIRCIACQEPKKR